MKLTIVCQEIPYPPIHGSRIDIWRRIKALADRGVELQVIAWWFGTAPTEAEIAQMQKYIHKLHLFQIERSTISRLRRSVDLCFYPLETTSRMIKGENLAALIPEVRAFAPDAIFLDGLHGGVIATSLSQSLQIPLLTRSHNIEYLYAQRLLGAAIGFKSKFRRYLSIFKLQKYERKILEQSTFFYDISADDLKFWQQQGLTNGRLLPPIIEFEDRQSATSDDRQTRSPAYDLVFLGNLSTENNVAGLVWFMDEVLPLIRDRLPEIRVLIAGLNPVASLKQCCERSVGVTLLINPTSTIDTYRSGRILINPTLTGSGVKLKSLDMLTIGLPIISTPEGVSGLPDEIKKYFIIANNAPSFAAATIERLIIDRDFPIAERRLLESYFGSEIVEKIIIDLQTTLDRPGEN